MEIRVFLFLFNVIVFFWVVVEEIWFLVFINGKEVSFFVLLLLLFCI